MTRGWMGDECVGLVGGWGELWVGWLHMCGWLGDVYVGVVG